MTKKVLKYPTKFENNMPLATFIPFKYSAGLPSDATDNPNTNKNFDDIPFGEIALYMPNDFSENITANWSQEEILQGSGGSYFSILANNASKAIGGRDSKLVHSVQAGNFKAPVPMDMLLFKEVNPMSISFNFKMIPFDKKEGDDIIEICNTFKKSIQPSIDSDSKSIFLAFPVLWDIEISNMNGVGINSGKTSYDLMALTSCNVNYTGGMENAGVYSDNNPIQINLTLSFQHIKKHYII